MISISRFLTYKWIVKRNAEVAFLEGEQAFKAGYSKTAQKLLNLACRSGELSGCERLGFLEAQDGNRNEARKMFQKACSGGNIEGCYHLGFLSEQDDIKVEARKLYQKACDGGSVLGCYNLGHLEARQGNIGEARRLYQKACDGGIIEGWNNLGVQEARQGNQWSESAPGTTPSMLEFSVFRRIYPAGKWISSNKSPECVET